MQIMAGATTKSNKIGWGIYTTLGTIRALMWFCWSYCRVRKHRGEGFESGIFEDEPLVLNFLLRSFHPPRQTSVQGRNVCESLSSRLMLLLIFLPLSLPSTPPSLHPLPLTVLRIRQWKQWIWCLFLSLCVSRPPPTSFSSSRLPRLSLSSLVVTPCHTLTPMPDPPPPHLYFFFVYLSSLVL